MQRSIFVFLLSLLTVVSSGLFAGSDKVLAQGLDDGLAGKIDEVVIIKESGRIFVNGQPNRKTKLDILEDKYVFRYQVVNKPQKAYESIRTIVQLPEGVNASTLKPTVLGVHGVFETEHNVLDRSRIEFTAYDVGPDATLTYLIDLPVDAFRLTFISKIRATIETLPIAGLIALGFTIPGIVLLYTLAIFVSRAKDIFLRPIAGVVSQPPTVLPPAMVGVLINGYVGMREISATLIDLAQRGYIEIISKGEADFAFSRKKNWQYDTKLQDYERFFLDQMFTEELMSDTATINKKLNKKIWSDLITQGIEDLYGKMVNLGYFPQDPQMSHTRIRFIGMLSFFISVVGTLLTLFFFEHKPFLVVPWLVSMIASPLILHLALIVPARTPDGRDIAARWLGFRYYLTAVDLDKLGQSTDRPRLYEQYLAYSIVLGVERQWTQHFVDVPCNVPDWFFSESRLVDSYLGLAQNLFPIISFVGNRFSLSRKPTAI